MSQRDLREIHELLLQNVREENEKKEKEFSNSFFNINSKNNLISAAKEALRPRNVKPVKIKNNNVNNNVPVKIFQPKHKQISLKKRKIEELKVENIFTDKEYLGFMMQDLNLISSSLKNRQKKLKPINSDNNANKKKYNSYDVIKNENIKNMHLKKKKRNNPERHYNMVNLLTQIVGEKDLDKNSKIYDTNNTENHNYFNNLYIDDKDNKIYVKEDNNNNI